ncbi:30S ribosomal protein S8 [Candidatus Roizmanbacteria bacterium]|nr:30S ribosomal protein S8 [Candidatus Roizmanbacteria bacterium]
MQNSVIDLIIGIKNGYMARKETVKVTFSNFNEEVLKKLLQLRFIKKYESDGRKIQVDLLYKGLDPAVIDIKIFSKPGRRYYTSYKDLRPILGGLGCSILSTPRGILTNKEARKEKVGGELLFAIW